jgi:hypothetical protein
MRVQKTTTKLSLTGRLAEGAASTWTLLSETTVYLSRSGLLPAYENQLKQWRADLSLKQADKAAIAFLRAEIVQLRKNLRAEGHDLSLGGENIVFEGFRGDGSLREGFRRLAIVIAGRVVMHVEGEDNHIALGAFLEGRFARLDSAGAREYHYLWYKRKDKTIRISGSDTEAKEDFSRLMALYEAKPLILLAGLKDLK